MTNRASPRPSPDRPSSRPPSITIAFRTFARTLRHGYDNLGTLVLVSVCWYVGALLIIPLGAVTAGLHRVVLPMTEERVPNWREFFANLRSDLRWSSTLIVTLIGGILLLQANISFYSGSASQTVRWLAIPFGTLMLVWLGTNLFAFPLALRQEDRRLRTTLRNAVVLVISNAPGVLISMVLLLLLVILLIVLPPLFLVLPGVVALWGEENVRLLLVATGYLKKDEIADRERVTK